MTAPTDSYPPDSPHPDSPHPDSPHADSAHPDSPHADSAHADSYLNRIVSAPPVHPGRISFARLDGTETLSLADLYERSGRLAARLRERGVGPGSRIGILAANSLEWVLLDLAALRLKAETAGFEPGKFEPSAELMDRYGITLLFTDRPGTAPGTVPIADVRPMSEKPGEESEPLPAVRYAPLDTTTVKFTSGSTGVPKGLAATAGSIDGSLHAVRQIFAHGPGDDVFVFLPLSLLQQRYWIYSALVDGHDVTVSTYEAAFAVLPKARPTVVMGVPAFYESARRHIEARARRAGTPVAEVARGLFGDRVRYLWTGSAPASAAVLSFFNGAGLPIFEGYGLNETCIVTKNHPGAHREGSVGQVLPGKEVIIGEDGVISVRSDHPVNVRYAYAAPGDSERVFGPDGTVRTGDLGHLDDDGFLFVQGRADDVIVLDNGRKIVVRPIEERLRASGEAIAECVLYCPAQTDLVAVVSPAGLPADHEAIAAQLALANSDLEPDERIRRVIVAKEPFSIENGLLTSQFKPRRKQIHEVHQQEINDNSEGIHA
ncbi:Long-chain acyl-CoA synthetase (AMP-forming) [Streptomyces sp. yr375]|uniref:AMP-binding protein n=1 Tax=Streptomyces sp. yr375 TaxID=1761906 RepID=UPI0008D1E03D|nr:AMP-binding protein [Streptomyces sp. yr375]SES04801.1 Long-chain acyl-CoA synthetase (AMP-forming) [Streptomyces sp. yr375]